MARSAKPKIIGNITVIRKGSTYLVRVEDEAGKGTTYQASSDQALRLADQLDDLLADEEGESHPTPRSSEETASAPEPKQAGTVKWYNGLKGFGFVTPDGGGEDLFLHRSVLEQAGLSDLAEGTRVWISIGHGPKGAVVSALVRA